MEFIEAEKIQTFLRLFMSGSTGTGKTFSALKIAKGICNKTNGKVGLIDTEHNKSTLNADWIKFGVLNITSPYKVEDYIEAIHLAAVQDYNILIIDSISHAWNNVLSRINEIVEINKKENFRAWGKKGEGTDLQNHFVETLLSYPGHLICCCRAKMEYAMKSVNNVMKVVKMGVGNIQRDSIEYEFDIIMEAQENAIEDHIFEVTKDRTGKYQSENILPDEEFGVALYDWLMSPDKKVVVEDFPEIKEIKDKIIKGLKFFTSKKIESMFVSIFGSNKWQECRDVIKLEQFLEVLKLEYSKLKSK